MRITAIEPFKKDFYRIFADGEYSCTLNAEIIAKYGLKMGMEIDSDTLEELNTDAQRRKARERAYYLLGYRDHSEEELYQKLLKNYPPEIAAEIVQLMKEQGFLNDAEYAAKLARAGLNGKLWGPQKVYSDMLRRGIDKQTAYNALEECEWDLYGNLQKLIEKKHYRKLDGSYEGEQKVIASLLRSGYKIAGIKEAIEIYYSNNEEQE